MHAAVQPSSSAGKAERYAEKRKNCIEACFEQIDQHPVAGMCFGAALVGLNHVLFPPTQQSFDACGGSWSFFFDPKLGFRPYQLEPFFWARESVGAGVVAICLGTILGKTMNHVLPPYKVHEFWKRIKGS